VHDGASTAVGARFERDGGVPFSCQLAGDRQAEAGAGRAAAYLAALLGLSFYARRRIGARLWRRAHCARVLVYVLGVVHALGAGTDASIPWLRAFLLVTGVPIVVLFVHRLRGRRPARVTRAAGEGAAG
jgi:predicted ferric reductase